jgi:hypothetical protein
MLWIITWLTILIIIITILIKENMLAEMLAITISLNPQHHRHSSKIIHQKIKITIL